MTDMSENFKFRALTPLQWQNINTPDTGLTIDNNGRLILQQDTIEGTYTSEPLDSGIVDCTWHRAVLEAPIPENSSLTLAFFTSGKEDDNPGQWWGETTFYHGSVTDTLLYVDQPGEENNTSPGRYLTVKITFNREKTSNDSPSLGQVKIYYPRLTYLRYLPAVYSLDTQSRQFLGRYLSLFESMYHDNETAIAGIPAYFDPLAAPPGFLPWLAGWLSLDWFQQAPETQNRQFIRQAYRLYMKKGTPAGLADLVFFLTGRQCCIKEYYNNVFRSWGMNHNPNREKKAALGQGCTVFYRAVSTSVNTADKNLLANMGTYFDELQYTAGTAGTGAKTTYSHFSVGIFINPPPAGQLRPPPEVLEQIIAPFLPVFVRVKITRLQFRETYDVSTIRDGIIPAVLYSYDETRAGSTNDLSYGSYNDNRAENRSGAGG